MTGGTLVLGGPDKSGNSTALNLNGGTFNPGGFSESLGALTLRGDSTIDFGDGHTGWLIVTGGTWTGGTLTIVHGKGTPVAGQDQFRRLLYGVCAVEFDRGSGLFEVTPAPKPSSIATVMGLLGLAGWRERRKIRQARFAQRRVGVYKSVKSTSRRE